MDSISFRGHPRRTKVKLGPWGWGGVNLTCRAPPTMMNPMAIHIASLRPVFSHTAKERIHPENAPRLYIETCKGLVLGARSLQLVNLQ